MMFSLTKTILSTFVLIVMFTTGIFLTNTGKPYTLVLQTLHKLSSIVFLIILILTYTSLFKKSNVLPSSHSFMVLTLLFFSLSFISGALVLSIKEVIVYVIYLHRVLPFLSLIFAVIAYVLIYLKPD